MLRQVKARRGSPDANKLKGRHGRSTDDQHLAGIAGTKGRPIRLMTESEATALQAPSALLRPLADYEAAIGGGF
jgi:hypothetical protein